MSPEHREPFRALEAEDRARFDKDARAADAQAAAEQSHRRKNLVAQDGEDASFRGARARIAMERAEDDEKKRKRYVALFIWILNLKGLKKQMKTSD
jgi:hypothetical protein